MVERKKSVLPLLVQHEPLSQPIEPTVANLNKPASHLFLWITPLVVGLLASVNSMRNVAMFRNDFRVGLVAFSPPIRWIEVTASCAWVALDMAPSMRCQRYAIHLIILGKASFPDRLEKTRLGRPAPGWHTYVLSLALSGTGISAFARSQKSSVTTQESTRSLVARALSFAASSAAQGRSLLFAGKFYAARVG